MGRRVIPRFGTNRMVYHATCVAMLELDAKSSHDIVDKLSDLELTSFERLIATQ